MKKEFKIYGKFTNRKTNVRNPLQIEVDRYKKEIGRNSLKYRGGVLWNSIDNKLKNQENITTFKNNIKLFKNRTNQYSFEKEACLNDNKNTDFNYF